jgi:hypothetical protein
MRHPLPARPQGSPARPATSVDSRPNC